MGDITIHGGGAHELANEKDVARLHCTMKTAGVRSSHWHTKPPNLLPDGWEKQASW